MLKPDPPMVCPKCRSTHFQDVQFNQYRKGTYAEIPVVATSDVAEFGPWVRVCVCGHPMGIAEGKYSVTESNRAGFEASRQKALTYRAALERETLKEGILQEYASREEARALYRKLSRLVEIVDGTDSKWKGARSMPQQQKKKKKRAAARGKVTGRSG